MVVSNLFIGTKYFNIGICWGTVSVTTIFNIYIYRERERERERGSNYIWCNFKQYYTT